MDLAHNVPISYVLSVIFVVVVHRTQRAPCTQERAAQQAHQQRFEGAMREWERFSPRRAAEGRVLAHGKRQRLMLPSWNQRIGLVYVVNSDRV